MLFFTRSLLTAAIAILATLAYSAVSVAQQVDIITIRDDKDPAKPGNKKPNRGSIPSDGMSPTEVSIDMAGVVRKFSVNEITKISFGDDPNDLTSARNLAVEQKNYNSAKDQLAKLDPAKVEREYVKQDIIYYKAFVDAKLALTEGGNKKDAAVALYKFYQAYPKSYHFYEAAELLGDLGVATANYESAAKYYGETGLGGAPWPEYKLRAGLAMGRALVMAEKFDDAAQAFDTVSGSAETNAEANALKQHALVGKALCMGQTGKPDEGIAVLTDIVAKNDPQLDGKLFARAYNAMGNCYLQQKKSKDALMSFLKTDLLFFTDSDAHAEALSKLSKLWDETGHSDRGTEARNKLRERYSGSIWAGK